jgi:hypothetical protein
MNNFINTITELNYKYKDITNVLRCSNKYNKFFNKSLKDENKKVVFIVELKKLYQINNKLFFNIYETAPQPIEFEIFYNSLYIIINGKMNIIKINTEINKTALLNIFESIENKNKNCCVCFENIQNEIIFNCNVCTAFICESCIKKILNLNSICPQCRHPLIIPK